MKVVIYTLNSDGSIPTYIADGGHFPRTVEADWPQDEALVGVVGDNAPGIGLSERELIDYLSEFIDSIPSPPPFTAAKQGLSDYVAYWWTTRVANTL